MPILIFWLLEQVFYIIPSRICRVTEAIAASRNICFQSDADGKALDNVRSTLYSRLSQDFIRTLKNQLILAFQKNNVKKLGSLIFCVLRPTFPRVSATTTDHFWKWQKFHGAYLTEQSKSWFQFYLAKKPSSIWKLKHETVLVFWDKVRWPKQKKFQKIEDLVKKTNYFYKPTKPKSQLETTKLDYYFICSVLLGFCHFYFYLCRTTSILFLAIKKTTLVCVYGDRDGDGGWRRGRTNGHFGFRSETLVTQKNLY